tara:strand:- start:181 stop:384 length:204 start_codon:yes stop_codon:yes gene_type:complete
MSYSNKQIYPSFTIRGFIVEIIPELTVSVSSIPIKNITSLSLSPTTNLTPTTIIKNITNYTSNVILS